MNRLEYFVLDESDDYAERTCKSLGEARALALRLKSDSRQRYYIYLGDTSGNSELLEII